MKKLSPTAKMCMLQKHETRYESYEKEIMIMPNGAKKMLM